MKFAWKGDPETRQPYTAVFGMSFLEGEPTDVSGLSLEQQRKLAANREFEPADKEAQELAATPRPSARAAGNGAAATELSELWRRLAAVEKDNDTLRKAVSELSGQVRGLASRVDGLTEPTEPGKIKTKDGK